MAGKYGMQHRTIRYYQQAGNDLARLVGWPFTVASSKLTCAQFANNLAGWLCDPTVPADQIGHRAIQLAAAVQRHTLIGLFCTMRSTT